MIEPPLRRRAGGGGGGGGEGCGTRPSWAKPVDGGGWAWWSDIEGAEIVDKSAGADDGAMPVGHASAGAAGCKKRHGQTLHRPCMKWRQTESRSMTTRRKFKKSDLPHEMKKRF